MKRIFTSLVLLFGLIYQGQAQLLPANQCESQTPCNAKPLCGTVINSAFSYSTTPAFNPVGTCASSTGTFSYTSNWMYYKFTCNTTGTFNFRLNANDSASDLDWAIWDITSSGCGAISGANLLECNAAGNGATGIQTGGLPAANFEPNLTITAGSTYILGISNPSGLNTTGYNMNFAGTTANILDNRKPYMASMLPFDPCNPINSVRIKLSEQVRCSQLGVGVDFTILPATPAFTVTPGANCPGCVNAAPNAAPTFANATDTATLTFVTNLAPGTYTITAVANAFFDLCGNSDSVPKTLVFTVPGTFQAQVHTGFDCVNIKYVDTVCGVFGTAPYQYKAVGGGLPASAGTYGAATAGCAIYSVSGGSPVTYTVKDAAGCEQDTTITRVSVLALGAPNLSLSAGPPCHDQFSLDSLYVSSVSGGTPPYTFSVAPALAGMTNPAPGLWKNLIFAAGVSFTVTVTDANGCTKTGVRNLINPTLLNLPLPTITNPICAGDSNGKLCFSATGGTPNYTYSINPTYPSVTLTTGPTCFNNLPAGVYTITATDANGCTATASRTLNSPPVINIITSAVTLQQPTCPNPCLGKYTPVATGGTGSKKFYLYPQVTATTWTDSVIVAGGAFDTLCQGTYTVMCKDVLGCTNTATFTLALPPIPVINVTTINPVPCFGGTGSILVNITTPTTPYTSASYTYSPAPITGVTVTASGAGGINATYANLPAGTYNLMITNANGCKDTVFGVVMPEPSAPVTYSSLVVDSVLCFGTATGTITAQATGGTLGANTYQYAIKFGAAPFSAFSAPTLAPFSFTNRAAGTYTIRVRDHNGCQKDSVVTIYQPTKLNLLLDDIDATCFGTSDGEICVVDTGGTPGYQYKLGVAGIYSAAQPAGLPYCFGSLAAGTYSIYTMDAKGCLDTLVSTVLPIALPNVSFTASPNDTVCDGTAITLCGTGTDTYSWTGSISDCSAFVPALGASSYTVTGTDVSTGCSNTAVTNVLVNPIPVMVQPANQQLCNGALTTAVNFASSVGGSTFNWTNNDVSIGLGASGTGNITPFIATNTGSVPVTATITVTPTGPTSTFCVGASITFTITVDPTPNVNTITDQTLCAGDFTTAVNFGSNVTGTTFNWSNTNPAIGIAGPPPVSNVPSFLATNAGATAITGLFTVTSTGPLPTSCIGTNTTFNITVDPIPVLTDPANQVVCNGASTAAVNFVSTVFGTNFDWTNSDPSIGLGASGSGNIPSFTAINTSNIPVVATITIIPTGPAPTSCAGNSQSFTITVNPTPVLSAIADEQLCAGDATTAVVFNSNVSGTTFNWTNTNPAIGLGGSGGPALGIPSFTAINGGFVPQTGVITVTPIASLCPGASISYSVTVDPLPVLTDPANQTLCESANTTAVNFVSTVIGSTFNWTNDQPSIGLAASGSGDIPSFTAINNGSTAIVATITVTPFGPNPTNCVGATQSFTITVLPRQNPSFTYAASTYCQTGTNPAPIFGAGATPGGTFTSTPTGLSINPTTGIINLVASTSPVTYTVKYVTPGPCPDSSTFNVTITNAQDASFGYGAASYCQNGTTSPTFPSGASAGLFSATPAGLTFINVNTGEIDLTNSNAGTYTVKNLLVASGGCAADSATTIVTIDSTTVLNAIANVSVCNNVASLPINFSSSVAGTTYAWTNNNPAIGLGASGVGNLPSFVPINTGTTPITATITVTPTGPAPNFCVGLDQTFIITVNPTPVITDPSDVVVCAGDMTNLISFVSNVTGSTFTWTNSNTAIGLGTPGTGDINPFLATNPGSTVIWGIINVAPIANGCQGAFENFLISVEPLPVMTDPTDQVVCTGQATAPVNFVSTVGGTIYSWTNNEPSIGLAIGGTGNIPSFVAVNTGTTPIVATITVTTTGPATTFCVGNTQTFTITVLPLQDPSFTYASSTYCQTGTNPSPIFGGSTALGGTFSATPAGLSINAASGLINLAASLTNTYTVKYVTPGPCPDSTTYLVTITNAQVSICSYSTSYCQTGTTLPTFPSGASAGIFSATPAGMSFVNVNTGEINLAGSNAGTYTVKNLLVASGGCAADSFTTIVSIDSTTVLTDPSDQTVCNGTATTLVNFITSVAGSTVAWTNNTTSIGLGGSGTGNIPSFTAVNGSNVPVTATITVTPTGPAPNFCVGQAQIFTITVNPTPVLLDPLDQSVCVGTNTAAVNFISNVAGSSFGWTNSNPAIGIGVGPTPGNILSFLATNPGSTPITGIFTVTPYGPAPTSCAGANQTFSITVDPNATLALTSAAGTNAQTVCINSPITPITYLVGATGNNASVSVLPTTLISNYNAITQVFTISGTPNVSGLYTYTVTATGSCGSATATGTINVTPIQNAGFSYPQSTYCQSAGPAAATITGVPGGTFSASPAGLVWALAPAAPGTINVSGSSVGTYTVTYTTPGPCPGSSTFVVNIVTLPVATFSYASSSYCQSASNPSPIYPLGASAGTYSALPAGIVWVPSPAAPGTINLLASSAGTYTVTNSIAASGACPAVSATFVVTITAKPTLSLVSSTAASCSPGCDGTATTSVSGGAPAFAYSIAAPPGTGCPAAINAAGVATGLKSGTVYTITVVDANSCSGTLTVSVGTTPSPIITLVGQTNTTTPTNCDGTATVSTISGTPAYAYTISGPAGSPIINALGQASALCDTCYLITVIDIKGCTDTVTTCIQSPGALLCNVVNIVNVSCNGGSNGSFDANSSGGTAPITFSIAPSGTINPTTGIATGLPFGTYTVTATDSNNIIANAIVNISQPAIITFNAPTIVAPSCVPGCDGSITVVAIGGTGPKTYQIQVPVGSPCGTPTQNTPGVFGGLGTGTYTITAIDSLLCTGTVTVVVNPSVGPTFVSVTPTDPSCNNQCNGSINVVTNGGTAPINYFITSPVGSSCTPTQSSPTSGNFSTLGFGTYTIIVSDANSCTISTTVTLVNPPLLVLNPPSSTNPMCNAMCNGTITLTASGGTGTLTYTVNPGALSNTTGLFNTLCAGNYVVTVTDTKGCSASNTVSLVDPSVLSWTTATHTNILCNGQSNGTITTLASGGTGTKEYSKDGAIYFPTGNFTGLVAGNYTITAKDANGCTLTTSFTIVEPPALSLSSPLVQNVLCNGTNTGSINISAIGGTPVYSFTLTPSGMTNNTGVFNNLPAGTYAITVTDASGCQSNVSGILLTQPAPLQFTLANHQNVACFGDATGSITTTTSGGTPTVVFNLLPNIGVQGPAGYFANLTAGTYTVIASDANNCIISTVITITQGPQIIIANTSMVEPICNGDANGSISITASGGTGQLKYNLNGGTLQTDTVFNNLTAGMYVVNVVDALGCSVSTIVIVKEPEPVGAIVNLMDANCVDSDDGKAFVTGTGGRGGYKYYITPGLHINKSGIFVGLAAGSYTLKVQDTVGCEYVTTIIINPPSNPLSNTITKQDLACHGVGNEGSATANVSGGTPPYTYLWSTKPVQTGSKATTLYFGYYDVIVNDANGCTIRDTVYIEEGPCCDVAFIPNAFSPNGDQNNDEFRVLTTAGVELIQLEIYNRWGKRVWSTIDYRKGWDGTIEGKDASVDTYYYILRYKCTRDNSTYTRKGDVLLVR